MAQAGRPIALILEDDLHSSHNNNAYLFDLETVDDRIKIKLYADKNSEGLKGGFLLFIKKLGLYIQYFTPFQPMVP